MPLTPEDLRTARRAAHDAKHQASAAKGTYWARMNPQSLPWDRTAALVDAAETAAWCIGWLAGEVERLDGERRGQLARVAGWIGRKGEGG